MVLPEASRRWRRGHTGGRMEIIPEGSMEIKHVDE
jgi:hypothetical protein